MNGCLNAAARAAADRSNDVTCNFQWPPVCRCTLRLRIVERFLELLPGVCYGAGCVGHACNLLRSIFEERCFVLSRLLFENCKVLLVKLKQKGTAMFQLWVENIVRPIAS